MPFPALKELTEKKEAKEKELAAIFDEAGPEIDLKKVKSLPAGVPAGDTYQIAKLIKKYNDELTELGKQFDALKGVELAAIKAGRSGSGHAEGGDGASAAAPGELKSLGRLFIESKAFKEKQGSIGPEAMLGSDVELKTLMTTSAGWATRPPRTGEVVEYATRPVQIIDLIPQTTTDQSAIYYMEETTFTNNAAEAAEAGTYAEGALALTERNSVVRKIAVFLPVTDEQLEDVSQVEGYVNNRLGFMIRQRLDGQILSGNGTPPNLTGILNVGSIQTQAKGADPVPDAIYKGMVKVRVTGRAIPNAIILHPTDWQGIRLLRTADGIYIWGNPSDAGPERVWGLPVAQCDAGSAGTGVVMDTTYLELSTRRGLSVQVSNSHGTYFIEGKQAIRADVRVAFIAYRPAAICQLTGL